MCRIVKKSDYILTDSIGYASFSHINFERFQSKCFHTLTFNKLRGPQGNYQYQFNATGGTGISETQYIYIESEVLMLKIVNETYPPTEQIIGVPFATQPIVQILDYYGKPLINKYVIAVSWPEPFIPQRGVDSFQNAYYDGNNIFFFLIIIT